MDTKQLDAFNAYSAAATQVRADAGIAEPTKGNSAFADLITNTLNDTTSAVQQSEEVSAKAVAGQADLVDVVTAASNAEMMVSTVVTVRDKVISAYQDVLKMPI